MKRDVAIVVSGGAGNAPVNFLGPCTVNSVAIQAPSSAAQYSVDVSDTNGYGITGGSGLSGNSTVSQVGYLTIGGCVVTIYGASQDGTYSVRLAVS